MCAQSYRLNKHDVLSVKTISHIQVHPSLKGVGYGSTIVAGLVGCYYNVIIAWCLFYLGNSIQVRLIVQNVVHFNFPSSKF